MGVSTFISRICIHFRLNKFSLVTKSYLLINWFLSSLFTSLYEFLLKGSYMFIAIFASFATGSRPDSLETTTTPPQRHISKPHSFPLSLSQYLYNPKFKSSGPYKLENTFKKIQNVDHFGKIRHRKLTNSVETIWRHCSGSVNNSVNTLQQ